MNINPEMVRVIEEIKRRMDDRSFKEDLALFNRLKLTADDVRIALQPLLYKQFMWQEAADALNARLGFTALDRIEVKGDEHERRATGPGTAVEE